MARYGSSISSILSSGEEKAVAGHTTTIGAPVEHLDLGTVIKVSEAVLGEIVPERLLDTLMRTALEHSGAERGLLIFPQGDELRIEAEATTGTDPGAVRLREAPLTTAALPESIVHFVARTKECVILDDAAAHNPFSEDTYLRRRQARSILCLPLINQAKLIGVLYLENNLTPHVFTPTRMAVLKLLASQAAISLENTRLYGDLQEREARVRSLIDASLDAIITIDEKDLVVEWSRAAEKMFGYSQDQAVGREMAELIIPPRLRDAHRQGIQRFHETGEGPFLSNRIELPAIRANGAEFPAEVSIVPIPLEGRTLFTGFIRDITKRKRVEEERERLRGMQAELAHTNRVNTMGELAASLAHEIKQPISAAVTSAGTCLRWLDRDPPNLAEARDAASRLVKAANRASDIIGRIGSSFKKNVLQRELVDVNELIREMILLLRSEAARFSISIHGDLADGLPLMMADRVQLQQVLMNLMLNGIEAMKEIGTPGELTIVAQKDDDAQILVSVADTGVGIQPEQADQMFDVFFTSKSQGTGMGLPISRSIIESHGGHLWATSNSGPGATFHFNLPIEVAAH